MWLGDATPERIAFVVRNMRKADREEIFATRFYDPDDNDSLVSEILTHWGPLRWAVMVDDAPVVVIGATCLWPGCWAAWMFATDDFRKCRIFSTKFVKTGMIPALHRLGAHRCEARSDASHVEAHNWLQALGARKEATLRNYGRDGRDFVIFRWDRNDDVRQRPESTRQLRGGS